MAHDINSTEKRKDLPVRIYEPYWRTLDRGQAIGYRKIAEPDKGYWIARRRPDESSKKYEYESLGEVSREFGYTQAKAAAEAWFGQRKQGVVTDELVTVADACRAYVVERRKSKNDGGTCAHDAEKRFERTVYGTSFGDQKLTKLNAEKVQEWRDGLKLKAGAANRTMTSLKAALYKAIERKKAPTALREDLRAVKPLPGEPGKSHRRELYLTLAQRRKLLKAAGDVGPGVRDLLEAAALTGARAGELVRATVSQFNARERSMAFITRKQRKNGGRRDVPLKPAAVHLFKRLAEGKAAEAPLFLRDNGQPWAHSDWDEPIREAATAAKLPAEPHTGVCAYTLRHCWITDTLRAGMSVLEVARLAGTSVQMLNDHYGHLVAHAARAKLAKVQLT